MHQRSISELQGASTQQGASTRRTTQDEASRSSRWRREAVLCSCPARAAPLWAWWLVLSALVLPGAWSFLSEEQEELLVELHNHYRGQVSPSASAMMPLRWDPSLKVIAEGYAAKCVWNHNPELEETGENLFAATGPLDLREALEKWFLEHLDYSFHNNSCDDDKMCGHYTQMVWADTHRVGCAFHLCNNMEGLEWERVSYLVCNYYPAGNYEDQRPYVEGDWCSRCPENLQKCENNMCVADSEEEEEEEDEDVEDGTDWVTLVPLPVTSDPALPYEEQGNKEEEEMVVPPPATTEDSTFTTTSTPISDPEDNPSPDTPSPDTPPPHVYSTTLGEEEEVVEMSEDKEVKEDEVVEMSEDKEVKEDEVVEMSEDKEVKEDKVVEMSEDKEVKEEKEEEERKEPLDKTDKEREIDESSKRHLIPDRRNSGSVSSPSLLLASLTGILSLRL